MSRRKRPPTGDYEVGYCRPPEKSRFTADRQPRRRRRKRGADRNEVIDTLDEPVSVRKNNVKRKMPSFEAAVRKLVQKALEERHLENAIEFIHLCEKCGVMKLPPAQQVGGVLTLPRDWDRDEWMAMLDQHGAPPWPGPRSGLTKDDENRRASAQRPPKKVQQRQKSAKSVAGADQSKPLGYGNPPRHSQFKSGKSGNPRGRPSRNTNRARTIEQIASEKHEIIEGQFRGERTTLELVLLLIRSLVHEGNRKAFRVYHRLLIDYGPKEPTQEHRYILVPESLGSIEEVQASLAKLREEQKKLIDQWNEEERTKYQSTPN